MRRFCQLVFLRHSLAVGRIVFPFVSSLVLLARLGERLVPVLCGLFAHPFHLVGPPASRLPVLPCGPFSRLVCRSSVSCLVRLIVPRLVLFVSLGRLA